MDSHEISAYLEENGIVYRDAIVVLRDRRITNFYFNERVLNACDKSGRQVHADFFSKIGTLINEHAHVLGADMLIGIGPNGARLAQSAWIVGTVSSYCYLDLQDENPIPDDDVIGRKVLIVTGMTNTGASIDNAVIICEAIGAEVVGVLTLVRCNPEDKREAMVGLDPTIRPIIALLDIDCPIIVEDPDESSQLLWAGLPVRLDVGYAYADGWTKRYVGYQFVGDPWLKK